MSAPRFTIVKVGDSDETEPEQNDVPKHSVNFARTPTEDASPDLRNDANDELDGAPFIFTARKRVADAAYYETCGEAKPHADNYR